MKYQDKDRAKPASCSNRIDEHQLQEQTGATRNLPLSA